MSDTGTRLIQSVRASFNKAYENEEKQKYKRGKKKTFLIRCGCLIKQIALQRGSLIKAPCFSSCVANPPSVTTQPPEFSIRSCNNDFFSPFISLQRRRFSDYYEGNRARCCYNVNVTLNEGWLVGWVGVNMDEIAFRFFVVTNIENCVRRFMTLFLFVWFGLKLVAIYDN